MAFTAQHGPDHTLHHDSHPDPAWFRAHPAPAISLALRSLPLPGLLTVMAAFLVSPQSLCLTSSPSAQASLPPGRPPGSPHSWTCSFALISHEILILDFKVLIAVCDYVFGRVMTSLNALKSEPLGGGGAHRFAFKIITPTPTMVSSKYLLNQCINKHVKQVTPTIQVLLSKLHEAEYCELSLVAGVETENLRRSVTRPVSHI